MARRVIRMVLLTVATLLALVITTVLVTMVVLRGKTPAIQGPRAIARLEWPVLGGTRQAVLLRGVDSTAPVLLFLHGGPGMPAMYLAHAFQRPLEEHFLVVQWDRRGAGKSYAAREPSESLTVERTLGDLFELTQLLRRRFHRPRVFLVAHSWGTAFGLAAVRRHPELYAAYVGMGQLVPDTAAADSAQRLLVLRAARGQDQQGILARVGDSGLSVREDDLFKVGGELRGATSFLTLLRIGLAAPEYTLFDALRIPRGSQLLFDRFGDRAAELLPPRGATIGVPVIGFLGRYDYNTPSALAAEYLQSLEAPLTRVVWFDSSAHFPFLEEPDHFDAEMVQVELETRRFRRESPPR